MVLKDKIVVITGSSHGIGKATALRFAKEGAHIVINYKTNRKDAETVCEEIIKLGSNAIAIQADVSDTEQVKELFTETVKQFGTVDILINNAGLAKTKPFLEITKEDLVQEFEINFFSAFYCSQQAAKIMLAKKSGKIINTVSICGMENLACNTILTYTTAKAALLTFTKALAKTLGPDISVNAVAPGFTKTRYWDMITKEEEKGLLDSTILKHWVQPDDIAHAFHYLATADCVTGELLVVDGGYHLK